MERLKKEKETIQVAKNTLEEEKKEEMGKLTTYIDTMHGNFAAMLKKTLEKMKDRIARAN